SITDSKAQSTQKDTLKEQANKTQYTERERATAFIDLGYEYRAKNLDSGLIFMDKAAALLPDATYDTLHFEYDYTLGVLYRYKLNYEESQAMLNRCLVYAQKTSDNDKMARTYYALSITYLENLEYEKAIESTEKARTLFREESNTEKEISALNVWATVLKEISQLGDAEKLYLEAYAMAKDLGNISQIEPISNNLAGLYRLQKKYDLAVQYFSEALAINKANNNKIGIAILTGNLGNLYRAKREFPKAIEYLSQAVTMNEELGISKLNIAHKAELGSALLYMGQKEEGLKLMIKSLNEAQKNKLEKEERKVLILLAKSTYDNDLFKEAAYFNRLQLAKSKIDFNRLIKSKVNDLNSQYQKEEQDRKIELLRTQKELAESKLSRQRLLLFGGLSFLILSTIISLVIFRLYQRLKKQNAVIEKALREKEVLLKEIHHRVKNNLQIVMSLLNIQSRKVKDEKAVEALQEGRARVESMSLIHQTLYRKENLTGVNLQDYLNRLCQSVMNTYQLNKDRIRFESKIEPLILDVDSVIPLGLIINELLTNCIKHAFPNQKEGVIAIHVKETKGGLQLEVADNGIGIPVKANEDGHDTFGLEMINTFKRKLQADVTIASSHGTQIKMLIRNYQKADIPTEIVA
ncbi:MAG: tetratricopeptide repeat protein, partial [Saprospiraceae bacterium]|nr:tetratricopeptide repeat protein [Saprospiraceae bacterium]